MRRFQKMYAKRLFKSLSAALVALLLAASLNLTALAQSEASTGWIEGSVTDSAGALVPGARISAVNNRTGLTRDVMTNGEGLYRLLLLPVGDYTVTVEKQGFATIRRDAVTVQVGQKVPLDIQLGAAGTSETVNVTS